MGAFQLPAPGRGLRRGDDDGRSEVQNALSDLAREIFFALQAEHPDARLDSRALANIVGAVTQMERTGLGVDQIRDLIFENPEKFFNVTFGAQAALEQEEIDQGITGLLGGASPSFGQEPDDFDDLFDDGGGPIEGAGSPRDALQSALQSLNESRAFLDAERASTDDPLLKADLTTDLVDVDLQIAEVLLQVNRLSESESGIIRLSPDMFLTQEQLDDLQPAERAQVDAYIERQQALDENLNRDILNRYNLGEYDRSLSAAREADNAAQRGFANSITVLREKLAIGEANIDQAVDTLTRQLSGLGESRARVRLETETARLSAATSSLGGQTSFTGGDLGQAIIGLARQAGIRNPETTELIRFPGAVNLDVAGKLAAGDAAFGVGGPLTDIPELGLSAGDVPGAVSPGAAAAFSAGSRPSTQPPVNVPSLLSASELLGLLRASQIQPPTNPEVVLEAAQFGV